MRNGFLLLEKDIFPPIFFPKKRKHESLAVKVTPLYIIWFSSFRKLRFPSAILISLKLESCVNQKLFWIFEFDVMVWCNILLEISNQSFLKEVDPYWKYLMEIRIIQYHEWELENILYNQGEGRILIHVHTPWRCTFQIS